MSQRELHPDQGERVWWTRDDLPAGPLTIWRGTARTGVREVEYVPKERYDRLWDICEQAVEALRYELNPVCDEFDSLVSDERGVDVDSWCERCGRKHTMRGQVEHCMGCGGNRFVFRSPTSDEERPS